MMLIRKSNGDKTGLYPTRFSRDLWDAEFQNMFQKGPGCFVTQVLILGVTGNTFSFRTKR